MKPKKEILEFLDELYMENDRMPFARQKLIGQFKIGHGAAKEAISYWLDSHQKPSSNPDVTYVDPAEKVDPEPDDQPVSFTD